MRDAPSVRSMPNSRVRWATVIEKVLKIWNAPTNSEIPAKTSSAILRKPRSVLMSSVCRCAASSPVSAIRLGGRIRAIRSRSSRDETPFGRGHRDLVELADPVGHALRLGQRHLGDAGAAEVAVAELCQPDHVVGLDLPGARHAELVADLEARVVGRLRVDRRLGRAARLASLDVVERLEARRQQRRDEVGREAVGEGVAVRLDELAGARRPSRRPRSTPSTSRTRGSSDASKAGGPVSSLAMSVFAVTATSVPFRDSLKISPNDSLIVSVRM